MLPSDTVCRHRVFRWFWFGCAIYRKSRFDLISIGRLGEIIHRSLFNSLNSSCDITITGEHNHAPIRVRLLDGFNNIHAITILQTHIHDGVGRLDAFSQHQPLSHIISNTDNIPTALHSTGKPRQPWQVVVNQKHGFTLWEYDFFRILRNISHNILINR